MMEYKALSRSQLNRSIHQLIKQNTNTHIEDRTISPRTCNCYSIDKTNVTHYRLISIAQPESSAMHQPSRHSSEPQRAEQAAPNLLLASTLGSDQLSVEFENNKLHYTNLDRVRGQIQYSSEFAHDEHHLSIRLLGISHVMMDLWHTASTAYRTTTSQWAFLKTKTCVGLQKTCKRAAFDFELPVSLQPHQCPLGNPKHLQLPPTLGCDRPDKLNDMTSFGSSTSIIYQIRVEVKRTSDNWLVGHHSKRFTFNPTPMSEAEAEGRRLLVEYHEKVRNNLGRSIGMMKLAVREDASLLATGTAASITSPIDLSFTYTGSRPPTISRIVTGVAARSIRRVTHSHDELKSESSSEIYRHIQTTNLSDGGPLDWKHSNTLTNTWHLSLQLPVTFNDSPDSSVIVPSFESCLVSRRYFLRLSISLTASSGTPLGIRSLEYVVPITIKLPQALSSRRVPSYQASSIAVLPEEERPSYWDVADSAGTVAPVAPAPRYSDPIPDEELERRPSWQLKSASETSSASSRSRT